MENIKISDNDIHKAFQIINNFEYKYDWNKAIKHTSSILNTTPDKLENAILDSNLYKWDKHSKQYIKLVV